MRIPTSKLQHLAIFTTVLTGGGIGIMYYLMQSECTNFIFFALSVTQLLQHCNLLSIISDLYQLVLCSYALKFNQV